LKIAINNLLQKSLISIDPLTNYLGAISVGIYQDEPILDLNYLEDSSAETDMNIVMNGLGEFIEVQGTAEGRAFKKTELDKMLTFAELGIQEVIMLQKKAFEQYK